MKFLYLTDVHIKGVTPSRRKDVYHVAILKKLMELESVIKNNVIDFVVIGGDLFDMPKISNKLYGHVARIMRRWGVKIFVVPGNHDIFGQNIDTLEHTSLGALASSGVVTLMTRDNSPYYFQKKSDPNCPLIAFTGQEYYGDIDKNINSDYEVEHSQAKFNVLVTHSMLVEKGFHPDVAHTVMKDVKTSADLVLSGHYHPERFNTKIGNTLFVKPRSTARLEATKHNVDHKPEYVIIEVDNNGFTPHFYNYQYAAEGKDIFDIGDLVSEKEHKNTLQAFKNTISNIDVKSATSINDILNKVTAALGSNTKHITSAVNRISTAQQVQSNKTLNGYIPQMTSIQIVKVILKNFQSHSYTEVDFDLNSLNALIGPSDNGKTSILRAIKWVLYNEPKGADFIRTGETSCEVTIIFSNGSKITRRRTKNSAGEYEVYDNATKKTETYTGFSHTIPMEIYNTHQMPKIEIGKNQVSFNIAEQLDGAFMLSLSSGDRAAFIGKITGVETVDDAIKDVSKDISNMQKKIKSEEKDIESLTSQLDNFKDLDKKLQDIQLLESILQSIETVEKEKAYYKSLQNEINLFNAGLIQENDRYEKFANLEDIEKVITKLELEHNVYLSYSAINSDYINNSKGLSEEQRKIKAIPDLDNLNSLIDNISSEYASLQEFKKVQSSVSLVEEALHSEQGLLNELCQFNESIILEMESLQSYYNQISELYTDLVKIDEEISSSQAELAIYQQNIDDSLKGYRELLNNMGTCPICHNHLDSETISAIEL